MTSYRIGIICRCLAALVVGVLCAIGMLAFPPAIVVLLPAYCGAAVWAMRDCKMMLLSGLILLCTNISSGMGLILWFFACLLLALISLVVIPLRLLWNLLALLFPPLFRLLKQCGGLFSRSDSADTRINREKPTPPRSPEPIVQERPFPTPPDEKEEDKDVEEEEEDEEEEEEERVPTIILHLAGPSGRLTFIPAGNKQWTVSAGMLEECSPGVSAKADFFQFIVRDDASGCGRRWELTALGNKARVLRNGVPMAAGESTVILYGDRFSLAPAESPRIPFLNLKVQFEMLTHIISKNTNR